MDGMYTRPPPTSRKPREFGLPKPAPRTLVATKPSLGVVKPSDAKTTPDTITTSEGKKIVLMKGSIATEQV